jgi:hypothetical protein
MMALLLGESAHAIYEIERLLEVGKGEGARDVVLVDHAPLGNSFVERVEFFARERRNAATAWNALFVG